MKKGRSKHSCGVIKYVSQVAMVVVAAGGNGQGMDSVEFLKVVVDSDDNVVDIGDMWEEGPSMPFGLSGAASATTKDRTKILVAGGLLLEFNEINHSQQTSSILCLTCLSGFCWWTKGKTELMLPRNNAIAIIVPSITTQAEVQDCKCNPKLKACFFSRPQNTYNL